MTSGHAGDYPLGYVFGPPSFGYPQGHLIGGYLPPEREQHIGAWMPSGCPVGWDERDAKGV